MQPISPSKTDVGSKFDTLRVLESIVRCFKHGIAFGRVDSAENIDGILKSGVSPGAANTEFAVAHQLGRVPVGYIVCGLSAAAVIYTSTGGTAWTVNNIYLKCSVVTITYSVFVF